VAKSSLASTPSLDHRAGQALGRQIGEFTLRHLRSEPLRLGIPRCEEISFGTR
jgi:hypothetical protein